MRAHVCVCVCVCVCVVEAQPPVTLGRTVAGCFPLVSGFALCNWPLPTPFLGPATPDE